MTDAAESRFSLIDFLHARLSRDVWLARAKAARRDGGFWGQRTEAECVEGARIWHRRVMQLRKVRPPR